MSTWQGGGDSSAEGNIPGVAEEVAMGHCPKLWYEVKEKMSVAGQKKHEVLAQQSHTGFTVTTRTTVTAVS